MVCTIKISPVDLGREGCAVNLAVGYIHTFACLSLWIKGSSAVAHQKLRSENLGIYFFKIEVVS